MTYTDVTNQTGNFDRDHALYQLGQLLDEMGAKMADQDKAAKERAEIMAKAEAQDDEFFERWNGRSMDKAQAKRMIQAILEG